jgi:large subunit ribosomal protein L30
MTDDTQKTKQEKKPVEKESKPTEKRVENKQAVTNNKRVAIILIRSTIGVKPNIRHTLKLLNLEKKNICKILEDKPNVRGMLKTVKDFVTWGEIDTETYKLLTEKRKSITKKDGTEKNVYNLHPPRKGYGANGVKVPFKMGGALGDRGSQINDLISRML